MTPKFSGKLALIAGGTGGLGRAVSLAFLAEGAHVVGVAGNLRRPVARNFAWPPGEIRVARFVRSIA